MDEPVNEPVGDGIPPSITEAWLSDLSTRDAATRASAKAVLALHLGLRLDSMLGPGSLVAGAEVAAVSREFRINVDDVMGNGAADDPRSPTDTISDQITAKLRIV